MLWKPDTFTKCYEFKCDDFARVEYLIQNPSIGIGSKDKIPLWGFYTLDHLQLPECTVGGTEYYSPCAMTCKDLFAVCIDYDFDNKAKDAGKKYVPYDEARALIVGKGWKAYMHTSYNHQTSEKGFFDRFRIILPMDKPIDAKEYMQTNGSAFRDAILPMFDGCDPSTLSVARFFKVPSCPVALKDKYRWDIFEGKLFSMKDWGYEFHKAKAKHGLSAAKSKAKSEKNRLRRDNEKSMEGMKAWLAEELRELGAWDSGNNIHGQLLKLNGWVAGKGMSLDDREEVFLAWVDSKHIKEVEQIVGGIP